MTYCIWDIMRLDFGKYCWHDMLFNFFFYLNGIESVRIFIVIQVKGNTKLYVIVSMLQNLTFEIKLFFKKIKTFVLCLF